MNTKKFGLKRAARVRCCTALTAVMCCGLLAVTHAQTNYQRLKSFGFPALSSGGDPASPLFQGNDGMLYGTTFREGSALPGTVFRLETNGSRFEVLYRFNTNGGHGYGPQAGLIQGTDGTLYGTTAFGGAGGAGTVFRLGTNGGGYTEFYAFSSSGADGSSPHAGLVLGSDGVLYGTTVFGGSGLGGTVFKVNTDGTGFTVLHSFVFGGADGINPNSILFQGIDGALYGTTAAGGLNNEGTIFKVNQNGDGFAVLHAFAGGTDGRNPQGGVVEGSDGALYGTTKLGGSNDLGTVFKVNKSGSFYNVLHTFSNSAGDGNFPGARMLKTSTAGEIYGTTEGGGSGVGTLFKLNNDGSAFTMLYNFTGGQSAPVGVVLGRDDGVVYGTRYYDGVTGGGTVFKLSTNGSDYSILHAFDLRGGDGEDPAGHLVQGNDGAIYGTTYIGGTNGAGTVFKVNPTDGSAALLWHFGGNAGDGQGPLDGLLQGSDGALYGTTIYGGSDGWGTLFKLNTNGGGFTVLHDFTYTDGRAPRGGLIEGSDGWLYGATVGSGFDAAVFKISKAGTNLTALRSFASSVTPVTLVQGTNGVLYGTTFLGGANGAGSLFSLTTNGDSYADLHSFDPGAGDGRRPLVPLIFGTDGVLYGTTYSGGASNSGTLFKLTTAGSGYTLLHSFTNSSGDGSHPSSLAQRKSDGALFGMTQFGGSNGSGTLFRLNSDGGGYTVLHAFGSLNDGANPSAGLVPGSDGSVYGTTGRGGDMDLGTVFKLFSSAPVIRITAIQFNAEGAGLGLSGAAAGQLCQIQANTNLAITNGWQVIGSTIAGIDGAFQFLDTGASNYPARFYRTAEP